MTPITTVRARLPCPTCGVVGPLTVAVRAAAETTELVEAGSSRGLPGGSHEGVVSQCGACWARRADRIAQARFRLQASGELTSLGAGNEDAWRGVPLSRCEEEFDCAFGSALLKAAQGEPLPAPPALASIELEPEGERETRPEPELAGV